MIFHEYDNNGWLVGWHEDAARASSTTVAPAVPPSRARWDGTTWIDDGTREAQAAAATAVVVAKRAQVLALLRSYDPAATTPANTQQTLAAAIVLLKNLISDL